MIELKVHCDCGQKYKFDVAPVNNQMPFTVACPICHRDGTSKANELLQQMSVFKQVEPPPSAAPPPVAPPPSAPGPIAPPPVPAGPARLRINAAAPATDAAAPPPIATAVGAAPPPPLPIRSALSRSGPNKVMKPTGQASLGMGILGAFLGAIVGVGAMFGFFELAGFRFPLLGVGIGILTGYGGKLLGKGTSNALGITSGGISLISVVATLFLMYGEFPIISIISVVVSISMAYRIASS